ncbi:MAG: hypothetical protein LBP59_11525 [Planctomycetaceae bacterium]|jgi:MFS family permease|nr:hypothetical protein [Planctomycetaceae bacterium]
MSITRQQIYILLILISASIMFGRIMAVDRVDYKELQNYKWRLNNKLYKDKNERLKGRLERGEITVESYVREMKKTRLELIKDAQYETPILSGNDRSRWATIRALVEPDMRVKRKIKDKNGNEIEQIVWYAIDKVQAEKGFDTIDMVKHALPDDPDTGYLYSSKPPLLPTLMAIPYAAIYHCSKLIKQQNTPQNNNTPNNADGSAPVPKVQDVPEYLRIDSGVESFDDDVKPISLSDKDDRYFVVRAALVLFNLIPLVFCWVLLFRLIDRFGLSDWSRVFCVSFICFGTFLSTFIVTLNNHIPAMLCVTVSGYAAVRIFFDGERRWRYFLVSGFFGVFAFACDLPAIAFGFVLGVLLLLYYPRQTLIGFVPMAAFVFAGFFVTNYIAHRDIRPAYGNKDWYFFEYQRTQSKNDKPVKSYWHNPQGVDKGEESRLVYFVQATVGHHGLFSLTPVWALSFVGMLMWIFSKGGDAKLRLMAAIILVISLIVISFYLLFMGQNQRSYGGVSSALRWLFWLIPLWCVTLVGAVNKLANYATGRGVCMILLFVSIFSASYPTWTPWTHPWIYQLMLYLKIPVLV